MAKPIMCNFSTVFSHKLFLIFIIILSVVVADQAVKWWVIDIFDIKARAPYQVTEFFSLVMVWNYGVSFGMFSMPQSVVPYLLMALSLAISAVLLRMALKSAHKAERIAFAGIIGGALGNVIDRVRFGAVADFFYFHIGEYGWPAFNIADAAICIFVFYLLIYYFRS